MPSVEEIATKYASQLAELRNNSKPLINSLTMMAEDYIRHARIIVETIENHLRKADPEFKLPILYLIDSIVKNVKKDYVPLFTENIDVTFTHTFEQVKKVSERIRSQLWKLRQTWNEVFPTKKLYQIDVKCRRIDPGWPITAAPPASAQIHVNPKFITRALNSSPATSVTPAVVPSTAAPPVSLGSLSTGLMGDLGLGSLSAFGIDADMEPQLREQLLRKQKELLELQTRKIELELLATRTQHDLMKMSRKSAEAAPPPGKSHADAEAKQQQLLQQAQLAKHQTEIVTSLLSTAPTTSSAVTSSPPIVPTPPSITVTAPTSAAAAVTAASLSTNEALQDPRKRRSKDRPHHHEDKKKHEPPPPPRSRISPTPVVSTAAVLPHPVSPIAIIPPLPMPSALTSPSLIMEGSWKRGVDSNHSPPDDSRKQQHHEGFRKRSRDRTPPPPSKELVVSPGGGGGGGGGSHHRLIPSPSRSPTKSGTKSVSPVKELIFLEDPRKRKSKEGKGHENSKKERGGEGKEPPRDSRRSRQSSSSSSAVSPTHEGSMEIPSKRRKKSTETTQKDGSSMREGKESPREKKDKDGKRLSKSPNKSSSRHRRESGGGGGGSASSSGFGPKPPKEKEWDRKENYNARKSAVLKKNYRRATEVSKMLQDEDKEAAKKDKENFLQPQRSRAPDTIGLMNEMVLHHPEAIIGAGADTDFRFEMLHDVDLRSEKGGAPPPPEKANSSGAAADSTEQPPPMKRARNGNLIDDLFGREDVDLRQQSVPNPATPSTTTWAQVKKPSTPLTPTESTVPAISESILAKAQLVDARKEEEMQDILQNHPHPPPAISPATSIDSVRSLRDPLGRPLLYNRLPDDPAERKRSLDSRMTIDPVTRFRNQFIEQPAMGTGNLSNEDLQKALVSAQQQLKMGFFTREQYKVIMKQLMQINEVNKIRDFQLQQVRGPSSELGPNPWTESESGAWSQFPSGPPEFPSGPFGGGGANPWGTPSVGWGQPEEPRGPNPFEEAAAAAAGIPPPMADDALPPVNPIEFEKVRKDSAGTIPIDKVLRQVRFYGDTAVVLQGVLGDEPREISFQKGPTPKNVFIDQESKPVRCLIGKQTMIYLDRKKHSLRLGAPTRELYVDGDHYEACFGGPPVRVKVGRYFHSFKLEGPPPQVELGKALRYDLIAGRVNLVVDGNSMAVYLDDKPQLLDLCGFPVILRFCDGFHTVLLNGRPFSTDFGGPPMSVTVPSGRKHFLRFTSLTRNTRWAMEQFNQAKAGRETDPGHDSSYAGSFRGRGGRRGGRGSQRGSHFHGPPAPYRDDMGPMGPPDAFHPGALPMESHSNPLDVLANIVPTDALSSSTDIENSYESSEGRDRTGGEVKAETKEGVGSMDVQDLLSKLMMAGLLPAAAKEEEKGGDGAEVEEAPAKKEKAETAVPAAAAAEPVVKVEKKVIPPLETVDVPWDKLKERRDKLIAQICTGIQCGSCGLRFAPDQNVRYSQHLDWHFRQNRREKANARKALSRKWYYDLSDWIQFAEIEDLEERAQSLFEAQEVDMDQDERSPGTVLNPDLYTVPSASHEGAICPQCNEGFESFYDEDKEEWRLRDAHLADSDDPGVMRLYHPICHQDFLAAAQGMSTLMEAEEAKAEPEPSAGKGSEVFDKVLSASREADGMEAAEDTKAEEIQRQEGPPPPPEEDEEEEVLILKEGKPEPVIMDILEEEEEVVEQMGKDEESSSAVPEGTDDISSDKSDTAVVTTDDDDDVVENIVENVNDDNSERSRKDSDNQNEEEKICILDADDDNDNADNNLLVEFNNKTDNKEFQRNDPSCITHTDINPVSSSSSSSSATIPQSHLVPTSSTDANIVEPPAEESLTHPADPGLLSSQEDFFDIIMSGSNQAHSPLAIVEEMPYKPILYPSMKFDVPTPVIKDEPVEAEELEESPGSLDLEMQANMGATAEEGPTVRPEPEAIDIDLTGDEETMDGFTPSPMVSAIEGNTILSAQAPSAPPMVAPSSRIKIRIMDAVLSTDSLSPKQSPSHLSPSAASAAGKESEGRKVTSAEATSESGDISNDAELVRLKPRLAGRKLTNYPIKETGKEVSGLCTIS